jgi:hypothetical protein
MSITPTNNTQSTPGKHAPTAQPRAEHAGHEPAQQQGHGRGHSLMMLACCVPMLLIAFALVATGAAGSGATFYALLCTAMMAAMMFAMPGHRH